MASISPLMARIFDGPIPLDIGRDSIRPYGAHSFAH